MSLHHVHAWKLQVFLCTMCMLGNWTQVLCKSTNYSSLVSHLSSLKWLFFWDRILCSLGRPENDCVVQDDLELLNLLSSSEFWDYIVPPQDKTFTDFVIIYNFHTFSLFLKIKLNKTMRMHYKKTQKFAHWSLSIIITEMQIKTTRLRMTTK